MVSSVEAENVQSVDPAGAVVRYRCTLFLPSKPVMCMVRRPLPEQSVEESGKVRADGNGVS